MNPAFQYRFVARVAQTVLEFFTRLSSGLHVSQHDNAFVRYPSSLAFPTMTIQQLRVLLAVVSHGGFRAASRVLDVSQGGLTKSIAALEEEYGIDLIDRNAKGVLLTPQGEAFLPLAKAIVEEADRAAQWLRDCAKGLSASVALGSSVEPSINLVPAVLRDFRKAMPNVTVRLVQGVASELIGALRENRIELAITKVPRDFDSSDLKVEMLYQSSTVIVARSGHALANCQSVRELLACDWLVVGDTSRHGAEQDDSVWELFDSEGLGRPRFAAVCSSVFGLLSILIESDALARVPRAVLDHPAFKKLIVEIPVADAKPMQAAGIGIIYKASRRLTPEAQMLVAMLTSYGRISRAVSSSGRA